MTAAVGTSRYSLVSIVLHWAIALAIAGMIGLGWWMTDAIKDPAQASAAFKAYQLHKSIGLTILVLSLVRLAWRFTHSFPPLPAHMPGWEQAAARASHLLLYAVMLLMPLTGWLYVSAGWNSTMNMPFAAPTIWFGQFEWPHLPGLADASDATRSNVAGAAMAVHANLAWGAVALIALHAAAALKHHFLDRDSVLASMVPLLRPRAPTILAATTEEPRT
jgi:cytochrome b561